MDPFALFAILVSFTALLSWVNARWLRLPPSIGVMAAALGFSVALILFGKLGLPVGRWAEDLFAEVDFGDVLMNGMLSFLLFAGALHTDLGRLLERKWSILVLATVGVALSTLLVGAGTWLLLGWLGLELRFVHCLLFGALISPTDPIAVLGILKSARAPEALESMIVGESLFNDGVGVVVFTLILGFVAGGEQLSVVGAGALFVEEALGGALLGLVLGWAAYWLLRGVDDYTVEVLLTLALVAGGYALAGALHTSGPIAMVVAGLFIGNHGRVYAMSPRSCEHLDTFWTLLDEILNAVLFVMIGLELLLVQIAPPRLLAGLLVVPLVLAARFVCVGLPIAALRAGREFPPYTVRMMTWGGLRGGISIALALSLPAGPERGLILALTYTVVVFSILVQGLSVGRLARRAAAAA